MIKLDDVIEGMEFQSMEVSYYYYVKEEMIIVLTEDDMRYAERDVDPMKAPEWQRESIALAKIFECADTSEFIALPEKYDIDEYSMMEKFTRQQSEKNRETLSRAISGKGAFRRFKDRLFDLDIQDEWYVYRDEKYKTIAIEWCLENNVLYTV